MDRRRWWNSLQDRFAISFSKTLVSIQNAKSKIIIDLLDNDMNDMTEVYDLTKDPEEKINIVSSIFGRQIKRYMMNKAELMFGFNLRGMGFNWRERFRESVN